MSEEYWSAVRAVRLGLAEVLHALSPGEWNSAVTLGPCGILFQVSTGPRTEKVIRPASTSSAASVMARLEVNAAARSTSNARVVVTCAARRSSRSRWGFRPARTPGSG